jgi:DNA-binding transcriptional LysR family regulator
MARTSRYKDIQLPQLRSFCWTATQKNFSTAARALGLTPSAVWQQVRALERRLGTTLVRRRGRSVEITPEGRLLLELIQAPVNALDSLERIFEARRGELPQHLTITSTTYLFSCHLAEPIQEFLSAFPAVRMNLRAGMGHAEVVRPIELGEADLGVLPHESGEARSAHLVYEPLFDLELYLLTAAQHPLARKKQVSAADLVRFPMILSPRDTHARRALERVLQLHDLMDEVQAVMETGSLEMMCKYAALGVGVAVRYLGRDALRSVPGLSCRPLDLDEPKLPVVLLTRKSAYQPVTVGHLIAVLRRRLACSST